VDIAAFMIQPALAPAVETTATWIAGRRRWHLQNLQPCALSNPSIRCKDHAGRLPTPALGHALGKHGWSAKCPRRTLTDPGRQWSPHASSRTSRSCADERTAPNVHAFQTEDGDGDPCLLCQRLIWNQVQTPVERRPWLGPATCLRRCISKQKKNMAWPSISAGEDNPGYRRPVNGRCRSAIGATAHARCIGASDAISPGATFTRTKTINLYLEEWRLGGGLYAP